MADGWLLIVRPPKGMLDRGMTWEYRITTRESEMHNRKEVKDCRHRFRLIGWKKENEKRKSHKKKGETLMP